MKTALDIVRVYENLVLAVDSGNPEDYLDLIQALTVLVFQAMNNPDTIEEISNMYGGEVLETLNNLARIKT